MLEAHDLLLPIDASAFPHIIDRIFQHADKAALLLLRTLSREFKRRADAEFARLVVFTPYGVFSSRGRAPGCYFNRCEELVAFAGPGPHYWWPAGRKSILVPACAHLVIVVSSQQPSRAWASLMALSGGLQARPKTVTLIFRPPEYVYKATLSRMRFGHEWHSNGQPMNRLGQWRASGIPITFVDAHLAQCNWYPCANCTHLDMFKAHFGEEEGERKGLEFLSMAEYTARVGEGTAKRHTTYIK
jgi:hypothetical protein